MAGMTTLQLEHDPVVQNAPLAFRRRYQAAMARHTAEDTGCDHDFHHLDAQIAALTCEERQGVLERLAWRHPEIRIYLQEAINDEAAEPGA